MVYGWMFILPLWGMAAYPDPGFSPAWTNVWLIGTAALFLFGGASRAALTCRNTPSSDGPTASFSGSSRPSTSRPVSARSCAVASGVSPATSTTWARDSFPSPSPWYSATSRIRGAWTYFIFIVSLFAYRQRDDDTHCAEKYGAEKWAEYQARVESRILPGVY